MKRISILAAWTLLILSSCHSKTPMAKNPVPVSDLKGGVAIKLSELASKKDVVCGMVLEGQSIADTSQYDGKLYGFCSTECKTEFLKNPKSYLSQL